jgi:hypothetical protein
MKFNVWEIVNGKLENRFGVADSDERLRKRRKGTKAKPVLRQHQQCTSVNQPEEQTYDNEK